MASSFWRMMTAREQLGLSTLILSCFSRSCRWTHLQFPALWERGLATTANQTSLVIHVSTATSGHQQSQDMTSVTQFTMSCSCRSKWVNCSLCCYARQSQIMTSVTQFTMTCLYRSKWLNAHCGAMPDNPELWNLDTYWYSSKWLNCSLRCYARL